ALALVAGRDFGMGEHDEARRERVFGDSAGIAEIDLEPLAFRIVANLPRLTRRGSAFHTAILYYTRSAEHRFRQLRRAGAGCRAGRKAAWLDPDGVRRAEDA